MAKPHLMGIDRLITTDNGTDLRGFWVGKVVDDGAKDPQGRITARIEALFGDAKTGIKDADLPKIQMMPSCGLFVRPQKDDFVTCVFQGSIYEGFYVGHTVNAKVKSDGGTLNERFLLNFHKSYIEGSYDGEEFNISVNDGATWIGVAEGGKSITIQCEGDASIEAKGDVSVKATGAAKNVRVEATGTLSIKGGQLLKFENGAVVPSTTGPMCGLPACLFTGAPHAGQQAGPG